MSARILITGQRPSPSNALRMNPRTFSVLSIFSALVKLLGHFDLTSEISFFSSCLSYRSHSKASLSCEEILTSFPCAEQVRSPSVATVGTMSFASIGQISSPDALQIAALIDKYPPLDSRSEKHLVPINSQAKHSIFRRDEVVSAKRNKNLNEFQGNRPFGGVCGGF